MSEALRAGVDVANIPTLLMVLVQLTGDQRWLDEPYLPSRTRGMGDNDSGGLPEVVQAEIRAAAYNALLDWRCGQPVSIAQPTDDLLQRMLSVAVGEPVPAEYVPMAAAELAAALGITATASDSERPPPGFGVLIIGAGASGLCAAVQLRSAGIPFTIIEKHEAVGGVWYENRYPGAGVDTPNHLYSFSFARYDWSQYFVLRDEIVDYLEHIASEFDLRPRIRFSTEVVRSTYDQQSRTWSVEVQTADGTRETIRANVVISAVGIFNPPKYPDVPGLDVFTGPIVHTACWPDKIDMRGKRVAVIGNGASAMQVVPAVVDDVASLTVFQRGPQWVAPFELFRVPVPPPLRELMMDVPLYQAWYRLRLGWVWNDKTYPSLQKDPTWPHPDRSLNKINEGYRRVFTRYLESELEGRDDLVEALLPSYPPFGKRMLLDNGWFAALKQKHVTLVTDRIAEIHANAVVTDSDQAFDVDIVILATGFDVVRFLTSHEIIGRRGRSLQDVWADDARAYLGMAVPDFPNFFCLYGPNTQPGHGGSLLFITECQVRYIVQTLQEMFRRGVASVECREEVHREFNSRVDELHEGMVWTHPGMTTYYRNSRGRVVVNTPYRNVDVWHMTRQVDLSAFEWVAADQR